MAVALVAGACTGDDDPGARTADTGIEDLPDEVRDIMDGPAYEGGSWRLVVRRLDDGDVEHARGADELAPSASTAKLLTVGSLVEAYGPDHTFETTVHAVGTREGGTLRGDLALVGAGDPILGGRQADAGGPLASSDPDQSLAGEVPGAELAEGDPLTGLDDLAAQVAGSGITAIEGEVVVDDRLWDTYVTGGTGISPVVVNENILIVTATPTEPGRQATLTTTPATGAVTIVNEVQTVAGGETGGVSLEAGPDGTTLVATGQVAADEPVLAALPVDDPARFARMLFVEALQRAGVTVTAPAAAANPSDRLPGSADYAAATQVASYRSPTVAEIATLTWKVSHNYLANMSICQLAVKEGSRDCEDGLALVRRNIEDLDIPERDIWLTDGAGAPPASVTPDAIAAWVGWLRGLDWGDRLPEMLSVLGTDPALGDDQAESPAAGKVQAKEGTYTMTDPGTGRLVVPVKSLAGLMEADDGTEYVFGLYMTNASFDDPQAGATEVTNDLGSVAAALQQAL